MLRKCVRIVVLVLFQVLELSKPDGTLTRQKEVAMQTHCSHWEHRTFMSVFITVTGDMSVAEKKGCV